jgi:hypothetical protein
VAAAPVVAAPAVVGAPVVAAPPVVAPTFMDVQIMSMLQAQAAQTARMENLLNRVDQKTNETTRLARWAVQAIEADPSLANFVAIRTLLTRVDALPSGASVVPENLLAQYLRACASFAPASFARIEALTAEPPRLLWAAAPAPVGARRPTTTSAVRRQAGPCQHATHKAEDCWQLHPEKRPTNRPRLR